MSKIDLWDLWKKQANQDELSAKDEFLRTGERNWSVYTDQQIMLERKYLGDTLNQSIAEAKPRTDVICTESENLRFILSQDVQMIFVGVREGIYPSELCYRAGCDAVTKIEQFRDNDSKKGCLRISAPYAHMEYSVHMKQTKTTLPITALKLIGIRNAKDIEAFQKNFKDLLFTVKKLIISTFGAMSEYLDKDWDALFKDFYENCEPGAQLEFVIQNSTGATISKDLIARPGVRVERDPLVDFLKYADVQEVTFD